MWRRPCPALGKPDLRGVAERRAGDRHARGDLSLARLEALHGRREVPERVPVQLHPRCLPRRERVEAEVIAVVHEVVDQIRPKSVVRTTVDRIAEEVRIRLAGRVGDLVALLAATALERVVQAQPVAGLVGERVAFVVDGKSTDVCIAPRQRLVVDDHAVHCELAALRVLHGEGRPAEKTEAQVRGVDVQVPVPAFVERGLHVLLLRARNEALEPGRLLRPVGARER